MQKNTTYCYIFLYKKLYKIKIFVHTLIKNGGAFNMSENNNSKKNNNKKGNNNKNSEKNNNNNN